LADHYDLVFLSVGGGQPLVKSLVTSGSRKIVLSNFLIFDDDGQNCPSPFRSKKYPPFAP